MYQCTYVCIMVCVHIHSLTLYVCIIYFAATCRNNKFLCFFHHLCQSVHVYLLFIFITLISFYLLNQVIHFKDTILIVSNSGGIYLSFFIIIFFLLFSSLRSRYLSLTRFFIYLFLFQLDR